MRVVTFLEVYNELADDWEENVTLMPVDDFPGRVRMQIELGDGDNSYAELIFNINDLAAAIEKVRQKPPTHRRA